MKRVKHYAKQKRQLRFLSKKLARLLESGRFYQLALSQQKKLIAKLQKLSENLKSVVPARQLQKALAGAAILLTTSLGTLQAQTFAPPVQDTFGLIEEPGLTFPNLVDIDGDGDFDILGVNYTDYNNGFRFIENVGTQVLPDFSEGDELNPFNLNPVGNNDQAWDFDLADMDDDGDMDIILGVNTDYDNEIASLFYYENIGDAQNPDFADPVIDAFGLGKTFDFAFVNIVDIDDDGDFDVFATEYYGGIKFFENTGTAQTPSFAAAVNNPFNLGNLTSNQDFTFISFMDLDDDGDYDALSSTYGYEYGTGEYGTYFYYQENIGTSVMPNFGDPTTETPLNYEHDSLSYLFTDAADLDDDGDLDILMSKYTEDKAEEPATIWLYFENTTAIIEHVNELTTTVKIDMFPNPVVEQVNLRATFEAQVDRLSIQLFNAEGKLLVEKPEQRFLGALNESFDVQDYPSGLYFIKIQADEKYSTLSFAKQ